MNVLILASWHPSSRSGSGGFIISQAKALEKTHKVNVVDVSDYRSIFPRPIRQWLRCREVLKNFRRPDIVHAHVGYPAGSIGIKVAKQWDVPLVMTEHTGPISLLFRYFGSESGYAESLTRYSKVIAVSRFQAKQLCMLSNGLQPEVVGNVVDEIFFTAPLRAPKADNRAIFVGALTEAKGFSELLTTLEIFDRKVNENYEVTVIGEGSMREQLMRSAQKLRHVKLRWLPSVDRKSMVQEMLEHRFLLLTSRYESFSLAAAEMLALGRTVLGFDCGGPADFVVSPFGELIGARDCELLAEKLYEFFVRREWNTSSDKMESRRRYIAERYSAGVIANELTRIYDGAIREFVQKTDNHE